MERLQTPCDIDKSLPNLALLDPILGFEVRVDNSHEVPSLGELHDDTEIPGEVFVEGLLEFDDVVVIERGQNTNLIKSVFLLLLLHSHHPHLLQSVDLVVLFPTDLVDLPESSFSHFFNHLEILHTAFIVLHFIIGL